MILGEILAKIGHEPLDTLLREKVLDPMGLSNTTSTETSAIPGPVLHSLSSESRVAVGIPAGRPFYEEATFWNAQWGTPIGANETTDIASCGPDHGCCKTCCSAAWAQRRPTCRLRRCHRRVVTFLPGAFDSQGNYQNSSEQIFRAIAAYLAPGDAPPSPRARG